MMRRVWRSRLRQMGLVSLLGLLLLGSGQAVGIKLRPQGDEMLRAVQAAIAQLATRDIPMTLDSSGGPTLTLGGVGVSAAPFNPDEISRVVMVGSERRIEFNPQGPLPLADAVRQTLQAELKLKDWTPAAAQQRFGGADLNGDGVIDLADLAILMGNFGTSNTQGDLNQDRKVDDADLRLFSALYAAALNNPPQNMAPPPAAAPTATPPTPPATSAPATPAPTPTPTSTPPSKP